eukprot:Colp12_sorted_trinity150504_noHs@6458
MVYLRAYHMLYPNFEEQASFATNHLEAGEHVKGGSDLTHKATDYTVPLITSLKKHFASLPNERLPALRHLPIIDVINERTTLPKMVQKGKALKADLHNCQNLYAIRTDAIGRVICNDKQEEFV